MPDVVSAQQRSIMMSGIKRRDTKPELLIRSELHRLGFRFRLDDRALPGRPDIVLPKYKAAIFINGCFWHVHDCHLFKWPQSKKVFWREKLGQNQIRDIANIKRLEEQDWRVLIIWECALKGKYSLKLPELIKRVSLWITQNKPSAVISGSKNTFEESSCG